MMKDPGPSDHLTGIDLTQDYYHPRIGTDTLSSGLKLGSINGGQYIKVSTSIDIQGFALLIADSSNVSIATFVLYSYNFSYKLYCYTIYASLELLSSRKY
ncbi:hypothetical protein C5167_010956 [Papaver somniferum]|uniref:Uncharacterized protein n=1 Tax=Papaver somniferum TaxID=3469 RepID=A0A4Y7K5M7_PAPSO|nr:hypothetical protein C5167_010956 [Papaver somniferum]